MTIVARSQIAGLTYAGAILLWFASAGSAAAQPLLSPPDSSIVCPGIEEDGLLCSADLLSGNCADFVSAAQRLGGLYRGQLAQLPGSEGQLLSTTWWGCGPGNLGDVTALLKRIGSPPALALLQTQPYAKLAAQQRTAPTAPPGPPVTPPDCDALTDPLQRSTCIGAQLDTARAENQSVFARCQPLLPAALRDDFADSQSTFQSLLPIRCNAQAASFDDKNMSSFVRSRCMVEALTENTQGILTAHPDCRTGN